MSRRDENFSHRPMQKCTVRFSTGAELRRCGRIVPVFLPFLGCPGRCVFCAQDRQTGGSAGFSLEAALDAAALALRKYSARGLSCELAFYGGTFTALPEKDRRACLEFLGRERALGHVALARCSTRPDALGGGAAEELAEHGIDLVELGIQSFSDEALAGSRRGYGGGAAADACRLLAEMGISFGIQLLPGMPGSTPEVFLRDVDTALGLRPACLRFYPCLVPEGTELARWYREGRYAPWSTDETAVVLGEALAEAWERDVPVIRLSVAPEGVFDSTILAGPRHPALGALIQAEALFRTVEKAAGLLGRRPERLALPRRCQGFAFGDRGAMKARWRALGLPEGGMVFEERSGGELS